MNLGPNRFIPSQFQRRLPLERLIINISSGTSPEISSETSPESISKFSIPPSPDALNLDVLVVGGGPAGLATAIALKQLIQNTPVSDTSDSDPTRRYTLTSARKNELQNLEIGILEKSERLGDHCLSGAIIHPGPFHELFPEKSFQDLPFHGPVRKESVYWFTKNGQHRLPIPRPMRNEGNWIGSICEVTRWLGEEASKLGIHLFTGFPAESLLVKGNRIAGVRTTPAGLDRQGQATSSSMPPTDVLAPLTVLAEGTRGTLSQAYLEWQRISSQNPQIYALGVKELWRVPEVPQEVIHTLGWPLDQDTFGGSWIYPMNENLLSLGLVVGLDYRKSTLDPHWLFQLFKTHPMIQNLLAGGEIQEWGAKTIPEGGFYSIPEQLFGDGLLLVGDAAGFVNVAALKGIHYAMKSGIIAAHTLFQALLKEDTSAATLSRYQEAIRRSIIWDDLYRTRNMRLAFKSGFFRGGFKAEIMALTHGKYPSSYIPTRSDADEPREVAPEPFEQKHILPSDTLPNDTLNKEDAVFYSGNVTRDDIPNHLLAKDDLPPEVVDFYVHLCPAGVYEKQNQSLVIHPANCIDCKATDVLGPRWNPREGGSGPKYKKM